MRTREEIERERRQELRIYWMYRWGMRFAPMVMMAAHWLMLSWAYGDEGCMPAIPGNNLMVVAWYATAYIAPFALLPATYLFGFGWGWRIPFIYLAGVNLTRAAYGSIVPTTAMCDADTALVAATLLLYAVWAVQTWRKRHLWRG